MCLSEAILALEILTRPLEMSPNRCLLDRSEQRGTGLREDKDLSVSPSRAKVSQRREGDDAS